MSIKVQLLIAFVFGLPVFAIQFLTEYGLTTWVFVSISALCFAGATVGHYADKWYQLLKSK